MPTTIKLKNSTTTTAAPSSLVQGEAAVNITDKKVWVGDASSTPVQIIGAGATVAGTTGTFTSNVSVAGTFAANGGVTLGDASGDALTINSSAVSIPNGLNFDSNTFVIDATNNRVGVGTASPTTKLQVNVTSTTDQVALFAGENGNNYIGIYDGSGTNATFGSISGGNPYIFGGTGKYISFYSGASERMRIDSSGNVGIGTSSPTVTLEVGSNTSQVRALAVRYSSVPVYLSNSFDGTLGLSTLSTNTYNTSNGSASWNAFSNTGYGASAVQLAVSTSGSDIRFMTASAVNTNPSERMRLDSSGNLGLGVTPSAWASGRAIQIGQGGAVAATTSGSNYVSIGSNWSQPSNNRYITSDFATLYEQGLGRHVWYTAPSGTAGNAITFTQAMTLDASGQLQLGTTSEPFGRGYTKYMAVSSSGTSAIEINAATGNIAYFDMGVNGTRSLSITTDGSVPYVGTIGALPLGLSTNGVERMRIDSSGNLLVGRTSQYSGEKFSVLASGASANTAAFAFASTDDRANVFMYHGRATGGTTGQQISFLNAAGSNVGAVNSTASSTAFVTSSDYRLKENIAPMTGALAKVAQLKPCTYTWKSTGATSQGFIAHELQEVVPECVVGEKDAVNEDGSIKPQGIDTSFLVATLTAALQEAHGLIKDLQARVDALESK